MAGRNFFKRSFEIIGGAAIDIGKDYTSNLQSLISDAGDIKNTVIRGAVDAKSQFQSMRKGNGPIKGLIDWFYTKENEFDMFDLDDDSDFDPGTDFGEPDDDDDRGPATLDVKGAEKVAKGHISSMFKIASKIAETQVANTAEIITTINSRTAEMVAAANNINTTLIGISKKLDTVTTYMNARSYKTEQSKRYDSLTDVNGMFTLGATWDAAKKGLQYGTLGTAKSAFSAMSQLGALTPEYMTRILFDLTLGSKEFKALGNQSINEIGEKFNDAIGQSISDALSNVMDTGFFKKIFGNLKAEGRSNDFRSYTSNEYTRNPAVFDGMTRTSIVKTIPEYLKKIYESISGKTLNVGKRGELTEKQSGTFVNLISDSMFKKSAFGYDVLSGYTKSEYGKNSGLSQYDANTIGKALTGAYIQLMLTHDIRVIDKRFINPNDGRVVGMIATYYARINGIDEDTATAQVMSLLSYVNSDRKLLNSVVGEINYNYEQFRRSMEQGVGSVNDLENVGEITEAKFVDALRNMLGQRKPRTSTSSTNQNNNNEIRDFLGGSGNPVNIYAGAGTGEPFSVQRTMNDNLNDIRELLSVTTKRLIGAKQYRSVSSKLSKPTMIASSVDVGDYDINDRVLKELPDYSNANWKDSLKDFYHNTRSDIKQNFHQAALGPNGESTNVTEFVDNMGRRIGVGVDKVGNKARDIYNSDTVRSIFDWGHNRVEDLKNFSKEELDKINNKYQDTKFNLSMKTMAAGLGSSKEDEEDKNTVSMISAFMQTAMNSGAASTEEKGSIQRLIDSIHNRELKQKLSKSVNAQLDRASLKESGTNGDGKKTIFGKILSAFGLILSPVKLIAKTVSFILPKIFTGLKKYTKLFNFGKTFSELKQGFSGLREGLRDYRTARNEQRALKKQEREIDRQAKLNEKANVLRIKGSTTGDDGSSSSDFNLVYTPTGMGSGFDDDYSSYYSSSSNDVKHVTRSINKANRIVGSIEDRRIKELIKQDEEAEKQAKRELKEAKNALKEAEKESKRAQKEAEKAAKGGGFFTGFKSGFGSTFKGIGSLSDFKESFKEAAGITGKKVTVEGVDGQAESFTDRILAKFVDIFTGKEDSVFKQIEDNTKEDAVNNSKENNDEQPGVGQAGEVVGSVNNVIQSTGEGGVVSTDISTGGAASGMMNLVQDGASSATGGIANLGGAAGKAANVLGGAGKAVSMIGKIGASVGKIVGSLGTIGMAVAKIVIKATMMLSGFKALMRTIGSVSTQVIKIVKIGLEPLSKIFHFINKVIKPIIKTLSTFFKKIMGMFSSVVGAVVDTIIPIINNIISPIMSQLSPVLDIITRVLEPMFNLISGVIDVVLVPIGGIFKYVVTPLIKEIANAVQLVAGLLEIGVGAIMKGLGTILSGIGIIGKIFGASGLYDAGKKMESSGSALIDQGFADVKNAFASIVDTAVKAIHLVDQTEDYDNTHIQNPNAPEINNVGSVMDGYGGGDFSRIYGSGNKSQRAYGSTLDISNNGCGPLALADAASRRSGSSVDGLSMASKMASMGSYEPGRGTSVGSFMNTANAMGMGLTPGGVTQASLKSASPNNPITVVGSGADFGTRKGNNHYMNVIGTDRYGGAYVSNPLTGRVDRKSASAIAGSSVLGLYGRGDSSDYYTFPDAITEAIGELKNLTASILGMFTGKTATDAMNDAMSDYDAQSQLDTIKSSINNAQNDAYNGKTYEEMVKAAYDAAYADFESSNPRQAGETEDAYLARFEKWYTPARQLQYIKEQGAESAMESALNHRSGSISGAIDSMNSTFTDYDTMMESVHENTKEYGSSSSSSGGNGGTFTADNGVELWTDKYKDNIEITDTDITSEHGNHSPLFEFFAKTMGIPLSSIGGYGWYEKYNNPNRAGVGQSGDSHWGIDFSGDVDGKPLYATTGGKVVSTTPASAGDGGGNIIVWKDAGGMNHWYMHMKNEPTKKAGDTVKPGDLLGYVGSTGLSTGPHLHYTINKSDFYSGNDPINPLLYFKNYNPGNGLIGDDNFEKIWSFLTGVGGLTPYAAAGLMGAWQVESGNDPNTLEGYYYFPGGKSGETVKTALKNYDTLDDFVQNKLFPAYRNDPTMNGRWNPNGYLDTSDGHYYPGLGLAQWTGGRTKNLLKFTTNRNQMFNDLESQLEFWKSEKEGAYANTFAQANAVSDTDQATTIILSGYEGVPGNKASKRQAYAREFFEKYKDFKPKQTPAKEAMSTNGEYTGTVRVDDGSWLNLRQNPSTESDVLAQIPNGTRLKLKYDGNDGWFKTTYEDQTGYVSSAYIELDNDSLKNSSTVLTLEQSKERNKAKQELVYGPHQLDTSSPYLDKLLEYAQDSTNAQTKYQFANVIPSIASVVQAADGANRLNTLKKYAQNSTDKFGFDIWQSAQYRNLNGQLGSIGEATEKRTNAFKYLAVLSDAAFDRNSSAYNEGFRNDWYLPSGKPTEQLSNWGAWSLDYNNWNWNPNKYSQEFPKELKALKNVYGHGDSDFSLPNQFSTSMNDISGFAKTMSTLQGNDSNGGNVTINRVTVASGDADMDARVNALLNNTYRVRAERVEALLEKILEKMDNDPTGTGGSDITPSDNMFNNNNIPTAVERLSRG